MVGILAARVTAGAALVAAGAALLAAGSTLGATVLAPAAPTPPARQALARSEAMRLLAAFPVIAGAHEVSGDPSAGGALAKAGSGAPSMSRGLVDHTAYYTISGDGTFDVYRDVAGDLPPGASQSMPDYGSGTVDGTLDLYKPKPGLALEGARIAVAATAKAGSYAVRIDAWAIAQPPRPANEKLTAEVRSVSVSAVTPSDIPPNPDAGIPGDTPIGATTLVSTQTSASAISALVKWFNARPAAAPFRLVCPGIYPDPLYRLQFQTGTGALAATIQEDGCGDLAVMLGGKAAPVLAEGYNAVPGLQPTSATGLQPLLQSLHALSGAGTSSGVPCTAQMFTVRQALSVTALGSPPILAIVLQNVSKETCTSEGFATLAFEDADHHALPTQLTDSGDALLVTIAPGQGLNVAVNPNQGSQACTGATVAYAVVTLPGTSSTITAAVQPSPTAYTPCQGEGAEGAVNG